MCTETTCIGMVGELLMWFLTAHILSSPVVVVQLQQYNVLGLVELTSGSGVFRAVHTSCLLVHGVCISVSHANTQCGGFPPSCMHAVHGWLPGGGVNQLRLVV